MRRTLAAVAVTAALVTGVAAAPAALAAAAPAAPAAGVTAVVGATSGADRIQAQWYWINIYVSEAACVDAARQLIGPDYSWWCAPATYDGVQYYELWMYI